MLCGKAVAAQGGLLPFGLKGVVLGLGAGLDLVGLINQHDRALQIRVDGFGMRTQHVQPHRRGADRIACTQRFRVVHVVLHAGRGFRLVRRVDQRARGKLGGGFLMIDGIEKVVQLVQPVLFLFCLALNRRVLPYRGLETHGRVLRVGEEAL